MTDRKSKIIQISVPPETYKLLQAQARKEKLREATLVISILRKHLEGEGE